MWIRCNPNPLGKQTSDCVVRAIAIATSQSWRKVYRDLCHAGEIECELPNSNYVWGSYLNSMGFKQFLLPDSCPKCITVRAFCKHFPEGTYILGTGSHAVCIIDGDYYDSWDSGSESPSYFWRVE